MSEITYSDFDVSLKMNAMNGDVIRKKDSESVRQGIKILFDAQYYERPWRPWFGSYFRQLLFGQNTLEFTTQIKTELTNLIEKYEPRISIKNLDVYYSSDRAFEAGELSISMTYIIVDTQEADTFVYVINRVR